MIRNMRSAGIELQRWVDKGLLKFHADRPNRHGLERHLLEMHNAVEALQPDVVIVDPVTNLLAVGTHSDVRAMLTRVIDYLKTRGITAVFTSLTTPTETLEYTETLISSLMDTWVLVANDTVGYERQRKIFILKSRGMAHAEEVRDFRVTSRGIEILPAARGRKRAPSGRKRG
jgi:circadian clock protein KaiC